MKLEESQLKKLSDICADIAQVSLASIAIPFALDKFNVQLAILGIVLAFTFWEFSLLLLKDYHVIRS